MSGHSDFFSKMFLTHHYVFKKSISLNKGLTERLPSQNQRWLIAQQGTDLAICFVCKGKGEGGVHQALLVDGGALHRRPGRMGVHAFHNHRGTRVVHVMLRQKGERDLVPHDAEHPGNGGRPAFSTGFASPDPVHRGHQDANLAGRKGGHASRASVRLVESHVFAA